VDFCDIEMVHFFSQAEIVRSCVGKWGNTVGDGKIATYDSKL
jgi:hypothetical protein